ncbi:M1 family peptidase [Aquimarina sp. AD10]|uniref:Aminopeptidase n=1 Tax=Aquimarina aggregata TaxID=1642818 RepID=A0A163BDE4_9FLAO|nr:MULTISPECIES: M1 family metallopeptidase [Aquimarina]AXT60792.1 M1 family peptidase [Aquimarina sp. AD10]KZS41280.1 aminopeptidase [Aquimarina aggregata]RKM98508.1 M1 family peptidase [Aquimarina sp. AD10]
MKKILFTLSMSIFLSGTMVYAQNNEQSKNTRELGHTNQNKFKQMYEEFATPNMYRTASGAPGSAYYQQQADYKMDIELDDKNKKLSGKETITYTNNSPDHLEFLWVQLDQNMRAKDSKTPLIQGSGVNPASSPKGFFTQYLSDPFDGGFNITAVKDANGKPLQHTINRTMMRVEMPKDLAPGGKFVFSIDWWYNINDHVNGRGRSGYEEFADGNRAYVIAQFYPRMAVYNDVEGWQNHQFWGRGEFALPFGNFEVNITVPADHILDGTGVLVNRKEVFSKDMMSRYEKAKKSYDTPVMIVTQDEAVAKEKVFSEKKKTWRLNAEMVRDFGFATSRRFLWDMMAVKIGDRDVMAVSMYPKEGNPLWEDWSTKVVASTLKSYSRMTFDYPYHKAISVHAKNQGMEYPMICWNYGRPDANGAYSDRTKYGMMSVIIHEVGHNFFPMIVNSDERQWTWMDEGLNTFVQYVAEQDFGEWYPKALGKDKAYPSRRGPAQKIVPYMSGNQNRLSPIMTQSNNIHQFGPNAYAKPATGLNILRETVMGRELFDYSFRTYSQRWMFKHPTPEDFFRTMEDASAVDLDWFWRGWFYTTDYTDIGVSDVKKFVVSKVPTLEAQQFAATDRSLRFANPSDLVVMVEEGSKDYTRIKANDGIIEDAKTLKEYLMDNFSADERDRMKSPKYFYEITFEKPGGLVMPLIVEYTYEDGTSETVTYPAQIWRKNDATVKKALASEKAISKIVVDPKQETADIDTSNNSWPKGTQVGKFEKFKSKVKGQ